MNEFWGLLFQRDSRTRAPTSENEHEVRGPAKEVSTGTFEVASAIKALLPR